MRHIDPVMGTYITVGHLLGQRSFLACKGADAVMFCSQSGAL